MYLKTLALPKAMATPSTAMLARAPGVQRASGRVHSPPGSITTRAARCSAVARASGWRLQTLDTTGLLHAPAAPLAPLSQARNRDMAKDWATNYVHSVDWRWLTELGNAGPGESWLTPRVALVSGEDLTPVQRLFTVADCANGLGSKIDIRKYTFLNTDLTVHVHRVPVGEWVGIRSETRYGPDGVATTVGTLFDDDGAVGVIQQAVLVRPRPRPPTA